MPVVINEFEIAPDVQPVQGDSIPQTVPAPPRVSPREVMLAVARAAERRTRVEAD